MFFVAQKSSKNSSLQKPKNSFAAIFIIHLSSQIWPATFKSPAFSWMGERAILENQTTNFWYILLWYFDRISIFVSNFQNLTLSYLDSSIKLIG